MNADKMRDIEGKIKEIDETVERMCESHNNKLTYYRELRNNYSTVYNGLKAGDEILRMTKEE